MEALVGLYLQSCQDDTSSVLADKCLELLDKDDLKRDGGKEKSVIARAKAVKGLVELVSGNLESGNAKDPSQVWGLYRRALEFLKAPPLESKGAETKLDRRDILALARGGYAEVLCVQQNRKAEGEKMKTWAEAAWRNRRLSLANALDISEPSSKVPVIDARISRVL
ncbi:hypothetical protein COLO4_14760 [Corchorus olitorius]|uniref:Uncharacterized protein n=1 Tax=Corchorus olitorius TaxID=93759 RepID=A0A1R3JQV3_9ROSI|nr:hypothetical protein COLO4_14760 [Corchorus olitorius]